MAMREYIGCATSQNWQVRLIFMAVIPIDVKSGQDFRDFQVGQGALEYLLLIGGAIVVAAVVITLILQVSGSSGGSAKAPYTSSR